MEAAYKKTAQDAIKDIGRYHSEASGLVAQLGPLQSTGVKVLLRHAYDTLKDSKKLVTSKLLVLLVLDDATRGYPELILPSLAKHKLTRTFEEAVNRTGAGALIGRLAKEGVLDAKVTNSIISYMWKWSGYAADTPYASTSTVAKWRDSAFSHGFPIGFDRAVIAYREVGAFLEDGSLCVGGLVTPPADPNITDRASVDLKSPATSLNYENVDIKQLCRTLMANPNQQILTDAQMMLSFFEQKALVAAENDKFEEYEKAAEVVNHLQQALRDCDKQTAQDAPQNSPPPQIQVQTATPDISRQPSMSPTPSVDLFPSFPDNAFPDESARAPGVTPAVDLFASFPKDAFQDVQRSGENIVQQDASRDNFPRFDDTRSALQQGLSEGTRRSSLAKANTVNTSLGANMKDDDEASEAKRMKSDVKVDSRHGVDSHGEAKRPNEKASKSMQDSLEMQMKMLNHLAKKQAGLSAQVQKNMDFQQQEFAQSVIYRQKAEHSVRELNQRHQMALAQYRSTETKNVENRKGVDLLRDQNRKLINERNDFSRQLSELEKKYKTLEAKYLSQDGILSNLRSRLLETQTKLADATHELETRTEVQKNLQQRLYDAQTSKREAGYQRDKMRELFDSTACGEKEWGEVEISEPAWDAYEVTPKVQHGDELALTNAKLAPVDLPLVQFELPFTRLQGPPFTREDSSKLEKTYRNACQTTNGCVYSDASLELHLSVENAAPVLACTLLLRNISNATIGDVELIPTSKTPDGPPPLELSPLGAQPCRPGAQLQYSARLIAHQPYMGCPFVDLSYCCVDNTKIVTRIKLPLPCTRLCTPLELRTQVFFEYWRDSDMEAQTGFRGRVRDVFFEKGGYFLFVKSLECGNLKMLPGIAASNDTVVLAGRYPRSARRPEVLVRADLNHKDRTIAVIIRSSSFLISNATARALADSVIISDEAKPFSNAMHAISRGTFASAGNVPAHPTNRTSPPRTGGNRMTSPRMTSPEEKMDTMFGVREDTIVPSMPRMPTAVKQWKEDKWRDDRASAFLRPSNILHRKVNVGA